jgi:hypothetical protein
MVFAIAEGLFLLVTDPFVHVAPPSLEDRVENMFGASVVVDLVLDMFHVM